MGWSTNNCQLIVRFVLGHLAGMVLEYFYNCLAIFIFAISFLMI